MVATAKVQIGEIYMDKVTQQRDTFPNKTRKYLLPVLKEYGKTFKEKFDSVFKIAVGIGDIIVDNSGKKMEKHIFVLIDTKIATKFFIDFLDWIRDQPMYEDDYVFNNIQRSTFHMVVIKLPEKFYKSLEEFKKGSYSKMYDTETMMTHFNTYPDSQGIFVKDHQYKIRFIRRLNNDFNTTISPEEWEWEIDYPPKEKTEKFNHKFKRK